MDTARLGAGGGGQCLLQQPQLPEQAALSGQPMHFLPLFLERQIAKMARPMTATITDTKMMSSIAHFFPLRAYSAFSFLPEPTHRKITIAAMTATAMPPAMAAATFSLLASTIKVPMV